MKSYTRQCKTKDQLNDCETHFFGWIIGWLTYKAHEMVREVFGITHVVVLVEAGEGKGIVIRELYMMSVR